MSCSEATSPTTLSTPSSPTPVCPHSTSPLVRWVQSFSVSQVSPVFCYQLDESSLYYPKDESSSYLAVKCWIFLWRSFMKWKARYSRPYRRNKTWLAFQCHFIWSRLFFVRCFFSCCYCCSCCSVSCYTPAGLANTYQSNERYLCWRPWMEAKTKPNLHQA